MAVGLGLALIDGDNTAVIAILLSLLIEGFAALMVKLVKLTRNWRRHRKQLHSRREAAPVPIA
jgi:hypothetical protein